MSNMTDVETRLSNGLSLFVDGRFDDAYRVVLDVVETSPGEPRLWQLLGSISLRGGRPLHAYQAFTRLRELEDDAQAQFSQLAAAYYAVDVSAARAHAEEAIARFPDDVEAQEWAAKMARITNEHDLLIDVGRALCRQGRYGDSIDFFTAAIESSDSPQARLWLGRAFLAHGEAENAVPLLESAASEIPEDPTIGVDVATGYSAGGRDDIAHVWLDEALRVHPKSADVNEAVARMALDEGDIVLASSAAARAVEAAPEGAGAWLITAGTFEAAGDMASARIAVDRSLALDPAESAVWSLGARIVRTAGDPGLASHYQAMAARLVPAPAVETQEPGSLQHEIDQLYTHVQKDPVQIRAYRDRATLNALLGLTDRALYYLDLVIRDVVAKITPELLVERGGLLLQLGHLEEAGAAFGEALRMDSGSSRARSGLDAVSQADRAHEVLDDTLRSEW